jgi:hypothetical protein
MWPMLPHPLLLLLLDVWTWTMGRDRGWIYTPATHRGGRTSLTSSGPRSRIRQQIGPLGGAVVQWGGAVVQWGCAVLVLQGVSAWSCAAPPHSSTIVALRSGSRTTPPSSQRMLRRPALTQRILTKLIVLLRSTPMQWPPTASCGGGIYPWCDRRTSGDGRTRE